MLTEDDKIVEIVEKHLGREAIDAAVAGEDDMEDWMDDPNLYDELMELVGYEMPYGTQKARTGDPHEWLLNKVAGALGL